MNSLTSFEPAFITLNDLAKRFNQSEEYFLMQGAIESLNLLVLIPETAVVGVTNFSGHIGKVKSIRHPDFLKLGLPQISDIRKAESALLTRFPIGYQLLKDGSLSSITAHEGWDFFERDPAEKEVLNGTSIFKNSGISMNEWTIKDFLTNNAIQFHRGDILIPRSDFQKLERELTRFVNIDLHHWHSTKVEQLYSASNLFGGGKISRIFQP